jgi:phosphatidylserine/phosphatidylglycerophosphate/cardiolipin synthase-like enzyme
MLWKQKSKWQNSLLSDPPNFEQVKNIKNLPGGHGQAILDDETNTAFPIYGSHHQKLLAINGNKGTFAFCGGVDINTDRRDSQNHGAFGAFHDVHAKVEGPAVGDIIQSFIDRWNHHPDVTTQGNFPPIAPTTLLPVSKVSSPPSVFVQVARTYPQKKGYPFARNYDSGSTPGSLTPLTAFIRAINNAKKFIYIEDQYLTPYAGDATDTGTAGDTLGVLNALRNALTKAEPIDYLLMVIPNYADESWLQKLMGSASSQARFRREQFIEALLAVLPEEKKNDVHVFYLGRTRHPPAVLFEHPNEWAHGPGELATEGGSDTSSGGPGKREEIYVHSKVWIVDDVCAKIGSANCNRRSYTNDSEMDVVMVDGAVDNGARAFARRLRLQLWGEHLGVESALLEDHKLALKYWLRPQPPNSHVRVYEHTIDTGLIHTHWDWVDPDGSL